MVGGSPDGPEHESPVSLPVILVIHLQVPSVVLVPLQSSTGVLGVIVALQPFWQESKPPTVPG